MLSDPFSMAVWSIALGLGLLALVWFGLQMLAPRRPLVHLPSPVTLPVEPDPDTGVVVAQQPGGRVVFANERARKFFGLNGDTPNLEAMSRRVRPTDTFLELFSTSGTARLSLGHSGQQLEATSLVIPTEVGLPGRVVVMFREAGRLLEFGTTDERASQTLSVVAEVIRAITGQLELESLYEAILVNLGRVFPYDVAEINLWEPETQTLRPVRIAGNRDYELLVTSDSDFRYRADDSLGGWVATHRSPLIVNDLLTYSQAQSKIQRSDFPFRAYAGMPLLVNQPDGRLHLLGTLELISFQVNTYKQSDQPVLAAIAGQAALAIQNARAYKAQERRVAELTSLAEITRAIEATAEPRELYRRLTDDIARLMDVQMVGVLLYDPEERALVAQPPFHGVPDLVVEAYRIPLPRNSQLEALWETGSHYLTNEVPDDPLLEAAGLRGLAETAGVHSTLFVPLVRGERRFGVVQVSNHSQGAPFTDEDVRLLTVFASQAAVILENARLVREAQSRAEQAEGLRRIAVEAASGTDLDAILQRAMQHTARLLHFDLGVISLLDETRGELVPHPASIVGEAPEEVAATRLRADDPSFAYTVTRTRRPFLSTHALRDRRIVGVYRPVVEKYRYQSVMDVPLIAGDRSIGEIIVTAWRERAFTRADLHTLSTIALQLASAIERARLYAATDADLQRRVDQLTAITVVGREINQTLELERILQLVLKEAVRATRADDGSVVLVDTGRPKLDTVSLRIGGDSDERGLTVPEREAAFSGKAQRFAGPPARLVVPIVAQEVVAGILHLWRQEAQGFDDTAVETATALAAQTAIAVSNAQRYAEQMRRSDQLRRRADQLAQLLELSRTVRSDKPLEENLENIAFGLQEAVGFNVIAIHLLDPQTRRTRRVTLVGLPLPVVEETRHVSHPWENIQRLMREDFRISQSFFLPYERAAYLTAGLETIPMPATERAVPSQPNAWHPEDMLIVPLFGSGTEPLGILSLDDPRDGQRPTRATIEVIEIFANQASLAVENVRLYQSAARRAQRLLALHRVIERVSLLTERERLWQFVAEALLIEMKLDVSVVIISENGRPVVYGQAGHIRPEIKLEPLLRQSNPLVHTIDQNYPLISTNVKRSDDWSTSPLALLLNLTSFITTPLTLHGEAVGALLVGSQQEAAPFDANDLELFTILANQLSAEWESVKLESDIKGRAAQLAALADATRSITGALRTSDVVEAVLASLRSVVLYDSVTLWLREGEQLRIAAAHGFENDAERLGLTVAIADSVLFAEMERTGGAIVIADTHSDPRFPGGEFQPTRSWLGAPLLTKGRIIGALVLDKTEPDFYSPIGAQVLSAFANQAAVALDNARLFEENEQRSAEAARRAQRLALINRVSAELSGTLDVDSMFATVLHEVMRAVSVEQAAIFSVEADAAPLSFYLPLGAQPPTLPERILARIRESLAPVTVDDITDDELVAPERDVLAARGVRSLLVMPLVAARTLVGLIQLEEIESDRRFSQSEIELVQTLANQAAAAIQNARLFDELQLRAQELSQRNDRMRALNLLSSTLSASLEVDTILREAADQLVEMFSVDHTSIMLVDEAAQASVVEEEQPALGMLGLRLTFSADAVAHQAMMRRVVIVSDVATDRRLSETFRTRLAGLGVRSLLVAPFIAQGRAFGAFTLESFTSRAFTTDEIELCQTIAAQIGSALTNAQFARDLEKRVAQRTRELERERERVETLLLITTELSSSLDLDRVLHRALQLVTEAVNAPQGSIFILDPETDQLIYRAALGSPKVLPPGGEPAPFKKHEGLVGWVVKNRQAVVIPNLEEDTRWRRIPGQNVNHRSALAVPLMANEEVLGAMILYSPVPNTFDEEQMRLASAAANQVGAASNNAELYRILREQAERLGSLLRVQQVETTKNRAILEGIADGVLVTDAEGTIILLNTACERILLLKRQETIGRRLNELVGLFGAAGQMWIDSITRWSQDPTSYRADEATAQRVELEDSHRMLSVSLAPVTTGDEYLGSVALIRDITREVEVDRLKSEFVTNVSHELLTPLTVIKGYTDVLLMGAAGPVSPMQAKSLDLIKNNADRLNLLVKDLLDRSRIESGKVQLVLGPVSLRDIVNTVLESLQAQILELNKPMNLHAEIPDDLPPAWGDHMRLTQVVSNVAENAYYYTPAHGTITIRAAVDEAEEAIIIEVSDTGVGIPAEHRPRLFDRFFRGENALVMATAGTGLGLSIARQLVEMQDGRLWLKETEEGKGSTFAIAVPLATREKIKELAKPE